ncbi:MAG TPA: PQQ-binding-like beta-propeller repeat protein [Bryobacteraceae bacterium]|nr:PQQ-binding-like beta-propeller repeat protein [Bryobacteraceae bacterium]
MNNARAEEPARRKPLRLWPGVIAVVLLLLARFGLKAVIPGFRGFSLGMMWSFGAALAVVLWWVLLSRARWSERLGAVVLMIVALAGTWQLKHDSMGPLWLAAYAVPGLCLALVVGAAAGRRLSDGPRRATIAASILLASGVWTLVRTEGITGDHVAEFRWRWAKSPEERLLARAGREPAARPSTPAPESRGERPMAQASNQPASLPSAAVATKTPRQSPVIEARDQPPALSAPSAAATSARNWPGFRGSARDGIVRGVRIDTDWAASPPVELWRRPIGPGWSSFAVRGDFVYTQEQRGDHEVVACYKASTGEPVWTHRDSARFFESNAGAGPRATPTLSNGRLYTFGATGILNALDAANGAVVWSRSAAADTEGSPSFAGGVTKVPDWGFASSPLVVNDVVIVAVAGQLVAYDLATGRPRWFGPAGGASYSSPHLVTLDGVPQVLLMSGAGATAVAPADGKRLWEHPWRGFPIVQPAMTAGGDVLIVASGDSGMRRIAVARGTDGWTVAERWTSNGLKPYFNDFVVHGGHAFGFDGRILACIDLRDGMRKWKGGRYGNGQLVLLPDQDLLLVLSEEGELALVKATHEQFTELARFNAIRGKTWNHPVLVRDLLLVRNGQEMTAFRLPLANR